jgi:hypothetical protein
VLDASVGTAVRTAQREVLVQEFKQDLPSRQCNVRTFESDTRGRARGELRTDEIAKPSRHPSTVEFDQTSACFTGMGDHDALNIGLPQQRVKQALRHG